MTLGDASVTTLHGEIATNVAAASVAVDFVFIVLAVEER